MKKIKNDITLLLPAGRLPLNVLDAVSRLASKYKFGIYLSTLQNLRLTDIPAGCEESIKLELAELNVSFKAPGLFPIPRICIGKDHCRFGLIDPEEISRIILDRFSSRKHTKAKLKIALAACPMSCSGVKTTDIGIVATVNGYEVYAGGKGGAVPRIAKRIAQKLNIDEVLEVIAALVDFHDRKTISKQRLYKLLDDPEFPYETGI